MGCDGLDTNTNNMNDICIDLHIKYIYLYYEPIQSGLDVQDMMELERQGEEIYGGSVHITQYTYEDYGIQLPNRIVFFSLNQIYFSNNFSEMCVKDHQYVFSLFGKMSIIARIFSLLKVYVKICFIIEW